MVLGGWATFHFFPSIEADFMSASVTMPQGTPVDMRRHRRSRSSRTGAARLRARLQRETGMDYFRHVSADGRRPADGVARGRADGPG